MHNLPAKIVKLFEAYRLILVLLFFLYPSADGAVSATGAVLMTIRKNSRLGFLSLCSRAVLADNPYLIGLLSPSLVLSYSLFSHTNFISIGIVAVTR